jgi:hypothetical protein
VKERLAPQAVEYLDCGLGVDLARSLAGVSGLIDGSNSMIYLVGVTGFEPATYTSRMDSRRRAYFISGGSASRAVSITVLRYSDLVPVRAQTS